ncbi:DUF2785 domain-containing protein [Bacillus sp. HMF5848]|uniref:DUF2785 domain-containing protein n=1 Tax=Bacillus sp. HMF5848 TaxID=2495421 RepID=UPI000F7A4862|nr:DUF2785 domain-containing protein [Bacillus sp. HMF5848]RSK27192.1 DUF2785 domain-containing protein [Bacillus sp. HMF5848]
MSITTNEIVIKEKLVSILSDDYTPTVENQYEEVYTAVSVLGSPDPELRDELAYRVLVKLLIHNKLLSDTEMRQLLNIALSEDMLFYKIGEVGSDSVFQRTFSALLIAILLYRDNEENYLSETEHRQIIEKITNYCMLEKDYRSFVQEKGWAHAPAHIADVIDECVKRRYTTSEQCELLWKGLETLLLQSSIVFDAEEEERMATAVFAMITLNKVSFGTIINWLKALNIANVNDHVKINIKHFTRALCLRLKFHDKNSSEIDDVLKELEAMFNPSFY